jgi:hypothetical protein
VVLGPSRLLVRFAIGLLLALKEGIAIGDFALRTGKGGAPVSDDLRAIACRDPHRSAHQDAGTVRDAVRRIPDRVPEFPADLTARTSDHRASSPKHSEGRFRYAEETDRINGRLPPNPVYRANPLRLERLKALA